MSTIDEKEFSECGMCSRDMEIFSGSLCKDCYDKKVVYEYMHNEENVVRPETISKYYEDKLKFKSHLDYLNGRLNPYYFNMKTLEFEQYKEEHENLYDKDIKCSFTISADISKKYVYGYATVCPQ